LNSSELTNYKIKTGKFDKVIIPPTSKSYANRALIYAAFSQEIVRIKKMAPSSDVRTLLDCLKMVGLDIEESNDEIIFHNSFPECEKSQDKEIILETGDGGTTNRFLLALLSLGKIKYILRPSYGMTSRPMDDLISALREMSISIEEKEGAIVVQGPPIGKIDKIEIDCSRSSQFASALMMAYPTAHLILKNLNTSKKYLEMTRIVGKEIAQKKMFEVPYDWSSLSYPVALGATLGRVVLKDVKFIDELQGDSALMKILRSSGGKISMSSEGICVEKSELNAFDFDCSNCPDLVPTLAYLAATIDEASKLRNIAVLKFKESDRLKELFEIFNLFNVDYSYDGSIDTLTLSKGQGCVSPVVYRAPADHRMIMTAYLFMRYYCGGEIFNYSHVSKSYPNFFQTME
jgi:3-phosphoshikimate 1-carboxyvinyltransferase